VLKITFAKIKNVAILTCACRLVAGTVSRLADVVRAQMHMGLIVLDLAEVTTVDASGLGGLVSLHKSCRAAGSRLKLLNLRPQVEELLKLTNLDSLLEVCTLREILDLFCTASQSGSPLRSKHAFVPA